MARVEKYPGIVDNFFFQDFIDDVKRERRRRFWSQRYFAFHVGRSPALISRWESRLSMPTIPDFLFVCDCLGLSPMKYFVIPEEVENVG